jgi:hypothetical protein
MTSKESLVAKTVLLKQVPTCVALENIFTYIANKLDNGKIEKYIRQTEEENDEDSNTWILLMNSAEGSFNMLIFLFEYLTYVKCYFSYQYFQFLRTKLNLYCKDY